MKTFTDDDVRHGRRPAGLWNWAWTLAHVVIKHQPPARAVTFVIAESADDLCEGGAVAKQVCWGENLVATIAACRNAQRITLPGGLAVWTVPVARAGGVDLLIIPETRWTPHEVMAALCLGGG